MPAMLFQTPEPYAHELAPEQERLCLLRRLAALQTRVSEQMAELALAEAQARARAESAESACRALQGVLIRERARTVLACTRRAWGVGGYSLGQRSAQATTVVAAPIVPAAFRTGAAGYGVVEVLCRTGCQGHAHPWLGAGGQCRLTASPCVRLPAVMAWPLPVPSVNEGAET